jgi:AP-3 complex subunit mu
MPKAVLNCSLTPNQGKYSFDPVSKVLMWDIGRIDTAKLPSLRGTVSYMQHQILNDYHDQDQNVIV